MQDTNPPLIIMSCGPDGRLTGASTARTLGDLHATEADVRRHLGRPRRPRRPVHLDRVRTLAA